MDSNEVVMTEDEIDPNNNVATMDLYPVDIDELRYSRENNMHPLLVRLQQENVLHEYLREQFFSEVRMETLRNHLNTGNARYQGDIFHGRVDDLSREAVRFASFYFVKTEGLPVTEIYQIDTIPVIGTYIVQLSSADIINALSYKIEREINVLNLDPGGYVISLDVYYYRMSDRAGVFHRDFHDLEGNIAKYVSLEYFTDHTRVYLGPETIFHPFQDLERFVDVNASVRELVANATAANFPQSMRLLIKDGSIIIFDNQSLIHATPMTRPGSETPFGIYTPFNSATRMENIEADYARQICENTEGIRSFIRSMIVNTNVIPTLGQRVVLPGSGLGDIRGHVNEEDFHGGGKNDLFSFKIFGNPLKQHIMIKNYFLIDPINTRHVKKYIESEKKILKSFVKSFQKEVRKRRLNISVRRNPIKPLLQNKYPSRLSRKLLKNKWVQGGRTKAKRNKSKKK